MCSFIYLQNQNYSLIIVLADHNQARSENSPGGIIHCAFGKTYNSLVCITTSRAVTPAYTELADLQLCVYAWGHGMDGYIAPLLLAFITICNAN